MVADREKKETSYKERRNKKGIVEDREVKRDKLQGKVRNKTGMVADREEIETRGKGKEGRRER
jgi:hypothetical protein